MSYGRDKYGYGDMPGEAPDECTCDDCKHVFDWDGSPGGRGCMTHAYKRDWRDNGIHCPAWEPKNKG